MAGGDSLTPASVVTPEPYSWLRRYLSYALNISSTSNANPLGPPPAAEPKAPLGQLRHERGQRRDDLRIPVEPILQRPIVGRPREGCGLAGAPNGQALLSQDRDHLPRRGRRHSLRLRTALIAWFSSAISA